MMPRVSRPPEPASRRLRAFVLEVHESVRQTCLDYAKIHELVAMLCTDRRPVIEAQKATMMAILRRIVADGQAGGEFSRRPSADAAAQAVHDALYKFHHPIMIALHIDHDLPAQAAAVADMLLQGLNAGRD